VILIGEQYEVVEARVGGTGAGAISRIPAGSGAALDLNMPGMGRPSNVAGKFVKTSGGPYYYF